jgi:hypothetical protein
MSSDWRFINAVNTDDSAAVPSAPSPLALQEEEKSALLDAHNRATV